MAFNGSGTFSLVSGNPVVTGTTISSTWANNTLSDIATNGLTNCIVKDGQTTTTNAIPFASGIKTNTVSENTSASGVTIDSVLLKDGTITLNSAVVGAWTSPAFDAGNFTASGSMTWTVAEADVQNYSYMIINKTMTVQFSLTTTTVGGSLSTSLLIAIPASKTSAKVAFDTCRVNDNGTVKTGYASVSASGSVISISLASGNFSAATDATSVNGQMTFEIE